MHTVIGVLMGRATGRQRGHMQEEYHVTTEAEIEGMDPKPRFAGTRRQTKSMGSLSYSAFRRANPARCLGYGF